MRKAVAVLGLLAAALAAGCGDTRRAPPPEAGRNEPRAIELPPDLYRHPPR